MTHCEYISLLFQIKEPNEKMSKEAFQLYTVHTISAIPVVRSSSQSMGAL